MTITNKNNNKMELYLERPNNQNQSEISKYKPLIVNTF